MKRLGKKALKRAHKKRLQRKPGSARLSGIFRYPSAADVKSAAFLDVCSSLLRYLLVVKPEWFDRPPDQLTPFVEPGEKIQ